MLPKGCVIRNLTLNGNLFDVYLNLVVLEDLYVGFNIYGIGDLTRNLKLPDNTFLNVFQNVGA